MQLPQISIQSQNALIGINKKNAELTVDSGPAVQTINHTPVDLQINTRPGKLTIDQSKALADVGIIPTEQSIKKNAQESMQTAMAGSRKRRHQGDELMKIENGGEPIARQAKINGERQEKRFNIGWIPSLDAVKINYQPAEVDINATANKPVIQVQQTKNQFQYQAGSVETYLKQKNWIEVSVENLEPNSGSFEINI
ncbi:DUF6470 family protein [Saliterribacillus persicus]|uniref:YviE n=1 Tax=Saliterribacillus persicus TaxID=930114 RepID=A0A368Y5W8_9BACI|nr:DUF6470 family protein [Saliterribacillus persicus]RCW74726.1 hypothetical protein DFR57_10322 [Saliterribacillus persicus]